MPPWDRELCEQWTKSHTNTGLSTTLHGGKQYSSGCDDVDDWLIEVLVSVKMKIFAQTFGARFGDVNIC